MIFKFSVYLLLFNGLGYLIWQHCTVKVDSTIAHARSGSLLTGLINVDLPPYLTHLHTQHVLTPHPPPPSHTHTSSTFPFFFSLSNHFPHQLSFPSYFWQAIGVFSHSAYLSPNTVTALSLPRALFIFLLSLWSPSPLPLFPEAAHSSSLPLLVGLACCCLYAAT